MSMNGNGLDDYDTKQPLGAIQRARLPDDDAERLRDWVLRRADPEVRAAVTAATGIPGAPRGISRRTEGC